MTDDERRTNGPPLLNSEPNAATATGWKHLVVINAVAMATAGIVLFLSPATIPRIVGVYLDTTQYLLPISWAHPNWRSPRFCALTMGARDARTVWVVSVTCIVFHAASGLAMVLAWTHGVAAAMLWNAVLRAIMIALFTGFGLARTRRPSTDTEAAPT